MALVVAAAKLALAAAAPCLHYQKTVFCRVPESSLCALFRAHDEDLLCRVSPEEHTAKKKHTGNLTLRRVPRASTPSRSNYPMGDALAAHGAGRGCGGGQQQEDRIGDRMHTRQTRMR